MYMCYFSLRCLSSRVVSEFLASVCRSLAIDFKMCCVKMLPRSM